MWQSTISAPTGVNLPWGKYKSKDLCKLSLYSGGGTSGKWCPCLNWSFCLLFALLIITVFKSIYEAQEGCFTCDKIHRLDWDHDYWRRSNFKLLVSILRGRETGKESDSLSKTGLGKIQLEILPSSFRKMFGLGHETRSVEKINLQTTSMSIYLELQEPSYFMYWVIVTCIKTPWTGWIS